MTYTSSLGLRTPNASSGGRCYLIALIVLLGIFLSHGPSAAAQLTTADVTGTITDASGAIVPGAKVTIENLGTHETRVSQTNSSGNYSFTFLQAGRYTIRVEASGFKVANIGNLGLEAGDHERSDAKLEVGQISQTVEVMGEDPLLQAENATVSSTITEQAVENLPTPTRNLTSLVFLTPGVNEAASNDTLSSGQRPDDRRQTSSFSVNGGDPQLNNNQLDGTDNNERIIGTIGVKPSLDMIEQVTVETNDYTPESGRSAGGVVAVITKSGTNTFHGSAYEFAQNNVYDANNPFSTTKNAPELRQNDFGGSVGGPIRRDKTFFFAGYEGFRQIIASNPAYNYVPNATEYAAIQSGDVTSIINSDPYTAGLPADPIAVALAHLYPAPNVTSTQGNFEEIPKKTQYSTTWDGRVDHRFSPNNLFFARYTSNDVSSVIPTGMPNETINGVSINPGNGQYGYAGPAHNIAYNGQLNYTHIFTPNLLLELKAGYTRISNHSSSPNSGTNAATAVGFPSNIDYSAASSGLPLTGPDTFAPLGDSNFLPITDLTNTFEYNGAISYTIGRHNIKAGALVIRRQAQNDQSSNGVGSISFSGLIPAQDAGISGSPDALAEFLVGAFSSEGRNVDLYVPNYRSWEPGFYAQDTWRVTQKLTLTYGLRYDIYTPFTEAAGRISNFDPVTDTLLVPAKGYNFIKAQGVDLTGIVSSTPTAGIKTDYNNFEPRIGFADTLMPGTVLRGGAGIAFYPGNYTSNASLKNAPFTALYAPTVGGQTCQSTLATQIQNNYNATGPTAPVTILPSCSAASGQTTALDQGIPIPPPQTLTSPNLGLTDNVALNFRTSSTYQFNLMVEQQIGKFVFTIGYAGQVGRHIPVVINDINVPDPHTAVIGQFLTVRPTSVPGATAQYLPNLGGVGEYYSSGFSHYHSLQTSLQRRYSNGLTLDINYTWSHEIDDATTISYEGQEGFGNLDPFDIGHYERGNGDMDLRNRFVAAGTYELPFYKNGSGAKKLLFGGWQANGIWIYNSGSPFSITDNYSYPDNSIYSGIGGGTTRPLEIANPRLPHPTVSEWFNRNAFESPQPGEFGNTPRNNLYGPRFQHVDLSLFKDFSFTERLKGEFRFETFNAFNHPNFFVPNDENDFATTNEVPVFAPPANTVFAQIVTMNPNYTPRELQIAFKMIF